MTGFYIGLGAVGGFALCWFTKDAILVMVTGTEAFVGRLETKARALRADL